ncbi:hypothetical protein K443DRAFT_685754 [Laccaria amethystina LaAM-08-1]|uniref:Rad60/SUMO-like domain-containing protein n=1 Tax=Laccaria amethystina LaAM-08-1 TaxID=1095629 RepID=A0A0C9X284_9AGAR|nr:hypothetical protein K443DRAFT_685754 [Laccaria amethystina LaAM-08-1]
MSQEPMLDEDVKPKLNLNISYDGSQITVKVKANMKFAKIFEAAEKRFQKEPGAFFFSLSPCVLCSFSVLVPLSPLSFTPFLASFPQASLLLFVLVPLRPFISLSTFSIPLSLLPNHLSFTQAPSNSHMTATG